MKRLGCLVALFGLLLGSMSVFLFGAAVWRLVHRDDGIAYAIPAGVAGEEMDISVSRDVGHRLVYRARISSSDGRNRIDMQWRIRARDGRVIIEGTGAVSSDDGKPTLGLPAEEPGAQVLIEHPLGTIPAGVDGEVKAWIAATPDTAGGARIESAWLVVRDDESDPGRLALGGAALMALGPMLVAIGFGLLLYGFIGRRKAPAETTAPPPATPAEPPAEDEAEPVDKPRRAKRRKRPEP